MSLLGPRAKIQNTESDKDEAGDGRLRATFTFPAGRTRRTTIHGNPFFENVHHRYHFEL